jgi:short subunit dehydrogenase-like uncharacterized protein
MKQLLIYGANGYTGRKLALAARKRGIDTILAGRNAGAVETLAREFGTEWRSFDATQASDVEAGLEGVGFVLNAASPFDVTARPLIADAIAAGSHYGDITGEIPVFDHAASVSDAAGAAGVMVMPSVGWNIVATDCLALHTARRADRPKDVRLFLRHVDLVPTRGSMRSAGKFAELGPLVRRNGRLQTVDEEPLVRDLGFGPERFQIVPLPDVITTWETTGIPAIAVYGPDAGGGDALTPEQIEAWPEGGTDEETQKAYALALAEVTDADGTVYRSSIRTISGYAYAAEIGAEIAARALRGEFEPGFQAPAAVYGPDLACSNGIGSITDL